VALSQVCLFLILVSVSYFSDHSYFAVITQKFNALCGTAYTESRVRTKLGTEGMVRRLAEAPLATENSKPKEQPTRESFPLFDCMVVF
jgi:hypothetical protein